MGDWININGRPTYIDNNEPSGGSGCFTFLFFVALACILAPIVWLVSVVMIKEREKDGLLPSDTLTKVHKISKTATIVIAIILAVISIPSIITMIFSGVAAIVAR